MPGEVTIEPTPLVWQGEHEDVMGQEKPVGWAFFSEFWAARLSPYYKEHVAVVRKPIVVMCPFVIDNDGDLKATPFCIDNLSTEANEPWDVSVDLDTLHLGSKPNITVHPSIHLVGYWHGWLQEGVLHQ